MSESTAGRENKLARILMAAFRELEFTVEHREMSTLHVEELEGIQGRCVVLRHPKVVSNDVHLLVASISVVGGRPRLAYCLPTYRLGVERVIALAEERL